MAFSYKKYVESNAVKNARDKMNKYQTYKESAEVTNARNAYNNLKAPTPYKSKYQSQINDLQSQISKKGDFTYDLNNDALYQQYKDKYINLGKLAMTDTMGQASALTGGYGNSYAQSVSNQAYQQYLTQLNDVVPQLYGMAMDKYNMDMDNLYKKYNMFNDADTKDYGKYRDIVSDYNTNRDFLYNAYNNARNFDYGQFSDNRNYYTDAYNNERSYDYGKYGDDYNRAFQNYQQQVSESQWAKEYALQQQQLALQRAKASRSGSNSNSTIKGKTANGGTAPTDAQISKAQSIYNQKGKDAYFTYLKSLEDSGVDVGTIIGQADAEGWNHQYQYRTYTLTDKGGLNWGGGIDNNARVKDQYGNETNLYGLKQQLIKEGMSDKEATNYIKKLQKNVGATWW